MNERMQILSKVGCSDMQYLVERIAELEDQITEIPTLCRRYEAKIAELKNLIADLQCTGVYCGLDGCLCDNCRIRLKALGGK